MQYILQCLGVSWLRPHWLSMYDERWIMKEERNRANHLFASCHIFTCLHNRWSTPSKIKQLLYFCTSLTGFLLENRLSKLDSKWNIRTNRSIVKGYIWGTFHLNVLSPLHIYSWKAYSTSWRIPPLAYRETPWVPVCQKCASTLESVKVCATCMSCCLGQDLSCLGWWANNKLVTDWQMYHADTAVLSVLDPPSYATVFSS